MLGIGSPGWVSRSIVRGEAACRNPVRPARWRPAPMLHFGGLGRMSNFTLQDVAGSAVAVVVFALALYVPGYVLGYAANLFGFRKMSFCERSLWAIAYSFAVTPIAGYLVGRYAGFNAACGLLLGIALVWLLLLWRGRHPFAWARGRLRRRGGGAPPPPPVRTA